MFEDLKKGLYQTFILDDNYQYFIKGIQTTLIVTVFALILGVILGSCLYRVIVAIALRFNLPASALKLVSAVIVGIAISIPAIKEILALQKTKRAAMLRHKALYEQQKGGR